MGWFCLSLVRFALIFIFGVQGDVVLPIGALSPKAKQMHILNKHLFLKYVSSLIQTEKKQNYLSEMSDG